MYTIKVSPSIFGDLDSMSTFKLTFLPDLLSLLNEVVDKKKRNLTAQTSFNQLATSEVSLT